LRAAAAIEEAVAHLGMGFFTEIFDNQIAWQAFRSIQKIVSGTGNA